MSRQRIDTIGIYGALANARKEHPELFEQLDELNKQLGGMDVPQENETTEYTVFREVSK